MTHKLNIGDAEELAKTPVGEEDVSQGEKREADSHEEDDQTRLDGTLVTPAGQTVVPLFNQALLAMRMRHELQEKPGQDDGTFELVSCSVTIMLNISMQN